MKQTVLPCLPQLLHPAVLSWDDLEGSNETANLPLTMMLIVIALPRSWY